MKTFDAAAREYSAYTQAASTCIRALALAVIAVTWLFLQAGDKDDPLHALTVAAQHDRLLVASLGLAVAALAFDCLQYVAGALLYQLLTVTLERVLADPTHATLNQPAVDGAWNHAADIGLTARIVSTTSAPPTDRAAQIAAAKAAVADLYDSSKQSDAPVMALRDLLDRPWSPRRYVRVTQGFFWVKTGAAFAAGVCLLVFLGLVVF